MENQKPNTIIYNGSGNLMREIQPEKICTKCGQNKPLSEYYAHDFNHDKKEHSCKECRKKADRERREAKQQKLAWFIFD